MPVQEFITFTEGEVLVKEYQALQIVKPQRLEGNIAVTNKRVILYGKETGFDLGFGKSQLAMDIHLDKIKGTDVLSESRPNRSFIILGIILLVIGWIAGGGIGYSLVQYQWAFIVGGLGLIFFAFYQMGFIQAFQAGNLNMEKFVNTLVLPESRQKLLFILLGFLLIVIGAFPRDIGWLFILGGLGSILYAFLRPDKTFALVIKAESLPPLVIGRDKYSLVQRGPEADNLIREIGALILDVQLLGDGIFQVLDKRYPKKSVSG